MLPLYISLLLTIAGASAVAFIFIGVLIQWSLRKALPSRPEIESEIAAPIADEQITEIIAAPREAPSERIEEIAPAPTVERVEEPARPAAPPVAVKPAPAIAEKPEVVREPVRIGLGLRKTRENFLSRIRAALTGSAKLDEIYEGLEEALIAADVGVEASMKIAAGVRAKLGNDARPDVIRDALKAEIAAILASAECKPADPGEAPLVIMLVGVNGVGKTTTVAKLAMLLKQKRGSVVVAAADTFRAAAIEQLQVWCDRAGAEMIKQSQGSDPAAVAFDAVKAAVARKSGALLIDTAGRLQTKVNLMEELKKIARVVGRELPGAPHETWLVLDANTGQNAISQAKIFGDAVKLTGVVLAKLDSTAKGGVVVGIAERLKIPVRYVGLGERLEDLREFDGPEFVAALFATDEAGEQSTSGSYAA
ncbi:MAG: signal recognition particle-docking protein FtsY [Candidatus Binatus sp.]|uniref:signal recognition particle-docking protein FtsY n=1 Tax=Candidatus Binatus sp. TaxID=2811406 RepID=UPI00272843BD|nr:signal recognition particle-docking protein FtsY [Candidatus Binatus sp.]MDO8433113.1 signal recognition particle-docking protein FtsY [Candidatus Binatus sp.]